jgi:hypothetical protein
MTETTTIDYFIDSRDTSFELYLEEKINIKSITLKNIIFYNSWWTTDIRDGKIYYMKTDYGFKLKTYFLQETGHLV